MASIEELKKITADKKALSERQKALRAQLEETKTERKEARAKKAEARRQVQEPKSKLRELCASIYTTFSDGDAEEIDTLANEIMEAASELARHVRAFGEAEAKLEDL